jgi:branched-chain amino acid transport system ATP-binding protein
MNVAELATLDRVSAKPDRSGSGGTDTRRNPVQPDGGSLLSIENLDAYYGKTHVLRDVSLRIADRDAVALMGRNGTGKTTIMLSIMGLGPRIERGQITFRGESLRGLTPEQVFNRGISWVPAERRVFPNLTVDENLRMGFRTGVGRDRYHEFRDTLDLLTDRENQRAGTLSGGQQQLLTVARGLVSDPAVVLIDEAFEGLMPSIVPAVQDLLQRARDWGVAVLIAGQSTGAILDFVDRVYIVENGAIEAEVGAVNLRDDKALKREYFGVGT